MGAQRSLGQFGNSSESTKGLSAATQVKGQGQGQGNTYLILCLRLFLSFFWVLYYYISRLKFESLK